LVKIARAVPEISCQTDRETDALITILRNRSRAGEVITAWGWAY